MVDPTNTPVLYAENTGLSIQKSTNGGAGWSSATSGIRAQSPVIEQVVVPERGELGSLLVLGVDLLGDREMRDYGFEGEDADLDDPLHLPRAGRLGRHCQAARGA